MSKLTFSVIFYLYLATTRIFTFNITLLNRLEKCNQHLFDVLAKPFNLKYNQAIGNISNQLLEIDSEYHQKVEQILDLYDELPAKLELVGKFLRDHKFYERDWREYAKNEPMPLEYVNSMVLRRSFDTQARFVFGFPARPLRKENTQVIDKCQTSALACINFIFSIASYVKNNNNTFYFI